MAKSGTSYSYSLNPSNSSRSGIDRISNLPAPVLSRILSLLPTKFAVATSALSTRWKFIWTTVTNLDFEDWPLSRKLDVDMWRNKFTQFVNRVLILVRQPSIHNFRLACDQKHCDPFYLNAWIFAAIERTIGELQLSLTLAKPIALPLCHFHCMTLSVLRLKGNFHFNIPAQASVCFPSLHTVDLCGTRLAISRNSIVSFPSLKILHICCSEFANEDSVHKLFSSCPVLDELSLKGGCGDNVRCLIICIPSLTSLRLCLSFRGLYKLQMETPALQYLHIFDKLMRCEYLPAKNLSSLLQATVLLDMFDLNSCISIFRVIESVSNVQSLSIFGYALKMIRTAPAKLSQGFYNLTRLELEKKDCLDWSFVITDLLETMEKLEHLVMKTAGYCYGTCQSWWTEPLKVPRCLLSRVSTISFRYLTGVCHDELELVRYFLKNAKVLEMMEVGTNLDWDFEKKIKLFQKITMFPRGSQRCQVEVS